MTTKIPKKRNEAIEIMLTELKGMIPALLICNGIVITGCIIYGIFESHDVRLYIGLLIGNAATIGNFCYLGFKAGNIVRMRNPKRARVYATASFFIRYIGAFIIFGLFIYFGIVNPITILIPLFYPKIHYTIKAMFNKEV